MLSNKWTFSLKILVVILTLVLVAPAAMAEFAITLTPQTGADDTADPDVSYADGTQIQSATAVTIGVTTGGVVQVAANVVATHVLAIAEPTIEINDFMVIAYNEFGGTEAVPELTSLAPVDPPDGKNFTMLLGEPAATVTRILILIPKHAVELADPRAELDDAGARKVEGKSAAASIEIHYVGTEPDTQPPTDEVPMIHESSLSPEWVMHCFQLLPLLLTF